VVLRDSTSISPDCRAVRRSLAVSGVNLTLVGIAKHRSGDGAAHIHVDAAIVAFFVGVGEAGQAIADAAFDDAVLLDRVQGGARVSNASGGQ
jgi:hypothetical protein